MRKRNFREFGIDERVLIVKQLTKDYFLWQWQTQIILTTLNPEMKITKDNFCAFARIEEQNEFYFISLNYNDENRSLQM